MPKWHVARESEEVAEGKLRDFEETPRTMKATRSIGPQEQRRPSLLGRGGWKQTLAGGDGGTQTVVRGWRVKGRDVLGSVDTAESPESEPSGAKICADENISLREGA